jgi:Zn-dependent protease with chaperone function
VALVGAVALVLAALIGARLLRGAAWTRRRPVAAIASWQMVQGAVLLPMVWIPVLALAPEIGTEATLREFVIGCLHGLVAAVSQPDQRIVAAAAFLVFVLTTGRLLAVFVTTWRCRRRERDTARAAVALVGSDGPVGVRVVPGRSVGAYCVPGRRPLVVMTTAATQELSFAELTAVVAHERAHLKWRHHLVLIGSQTVADAFPFVGVFVEAERECRLLIEMAADDQAIRVVGPEPLATALLRSAISSGLPPATLAMGRTAVQERVERLDVCRAENRSHGLVACVPLLLPVLVGSMVVTHTLTEWFTALASCEGL